MMLNVIDACRKCAQACEECLVSCLDEPDTDIQSRMKMIEILSDCADFCNIAVRYLIRNSRFSTVICELCADISAECATACEQFMDNSYQACAKFCRECAEICNEIKEMANVTSVYTLILH